jgi:hypothetical protein
MDAVGARLIPSMKRMHPRGSQAFYDAFWDVPTVAPIGNGTGTTHPRQVLVDDTIFLSPGWAASGSISAQDYADHASVEIGS